MSDTKSSLRRKIDGAHDLKSVVRTMKALAASSISQYETAVRSVADYHQAVKLGLSACLRAVGSGSLDRLADPRARVGSIGAIVFGSDQGLVGQFNDVVVEHAIPTLTALPTPPRVWAVGERVHARLLDAGLSPTGLSRVPNSVQAIGRLVGRLLVAAAPADGVAELHLFYNRSTAGASYAPASQRLLPLDEVFRDEHTAIPWPTNNLPEVMGDALTSLRAFIREYLFVSLFRACAESLASENASRLAAMQRAEKNIGELLDGLEKTYARSRQSSIDAELFDLIAGFEALS